MLDDDDDTLDLTDVVEAGDEQGEGGEQPQPEQADDGDLVIEIEGEEAGDAEETPLIKQLRAQLREAQRRNAEQARAAAPQPIVVGPEPDLWDDCEGDVDKYNAARDAWKERKAKAEKQQTETANQQQTNAQEFQRAHAVYRAKAETLGVQDFQASEDAVVAALPQVIQSAIVQYIDDPAKLVYALGRHPAKLAEIAAQTDPVRAILMLHDLGKKVVTNRKKPPAPESETIIRGGAPISARSTDERLKKLEEKADRTGDRTELIAYKRNLKAKAN